MSLLVDLPTSGLDPGYAEKAARRSGGSRGRPGATAVVVLVVALGLLLGLAAAAADRRAPALARQRAALLADVGARTAAADQLAVSVSRRRAEVAASRDAGLRLTSDGKALGERVRRLEEATGVVAASGPGLVVRLDDAPARAPASPGGARDGRPGAGAPAGMGEQSPGRVVDRDLQSVVNGLWTAGAEAVAVNGVRLTAQSAVRSAGEAILVDFRPVLPPYRVAAIGDPRTLPPRFRDGPTGRRLATYAASYGMRVDLASERRLHLPAAGNVLLRLARPLGGGGR